MNSPRALSTIRRPTSALSKSDSFTPSFLSSRIFITFSGVMRGGCSLRGRNLLIATWTTEPIGISIRRATSHEGASASVRFSGRIEHTNFGTNSPAASIANAAAAAHSACAVGEPANSSAESAADDDGIVKAGADDTSIFIYPGYRFRVMDALITNFHLPESTLVMLVSAFAGRENVLSAYKEAIEEKYRFFSFGDACFFY